MSGAHEAAASRTRDSTVSGCREEDPVARGIRLDDLREAALPRWRYAVVALGGFGVALTLALLAGTFTGSAAEQYGLSGNTLTTSAVEGADLFTDYCTSCHGAGGDRIPVSPLASVTFLDSRGDASLLATIADGKGTMPAYSQERDGPLDGEQIRSVVAFLNARAGRTSATLLAADGQRLYEQLCADCHGASGERIPIAPLAARGFLDTRSDAQLQTSILEGSGSMAGLGSGYGPRDAAAITSYLRYRVEENLVEGISHGRDLYVDSCLACHGAAGDRVGGVPLASAAYLTSLGDGAVITAVRDGTPSGPAFSTAHGGQFDIQDTASVLSYLKSWAGLNATASLTAGGVVQTSGESLFVSNCAPCHGQTGAEVQGVALKSEAFLSTETRAAIVTTVTVGGHTGMPASGIDAGGALSQAQITNIVDYLFTIAGVTPDVVAPPVTAGPGVSQPPPAVTATPEPLDVNAAIFDGETAAAYYGANCSICHGEDLAGGSGPSLLAADLTEDAIFYREVLAVGLMAPYGGDLTDKQNATMVAFLKGADDSSSDADTSDDGGDTAAPFGGSSVEAFYGTACASCHGDDLSGGFGPSLLDVDLTEKDSFYIEKLTSGSMAREASDLGSEEIAALVSFLRGGDAGSASNAPPAVDLSGALVGGLSIDEFYSSKCASCHGDNQEGGRGPSLYPEELTENPSFYFDKIASGSMSRLAGDLTSEEVDTIVAFLLGAGSDGGSASSEPADDSGPAIVQPQLFSQELYVDMCAGCHGDDGMNIDTAPLGSRNWITNMSAEGLLLRIGRGKTSQGMPTFGVEFGGWLTPEQIESLAIYLREMSQ